MATNITSVILNRAWCQREVFKAKKTHLTFNIGLIWMAYEYEYREIRIG